MALKPYKCIQIRQLAEENDEYKDDSVRNPVRLIALKAAKDGTNRHNKIIVVEDTGLFFNAYIDFPGFKPKCIIKRIG